MSTSTRFATRRVRRVIATVLFVGAACLAPHADEPNPASASRAREALGRLKSGNDRFVRNAMSPVSLSAATRQALTKGQAPSAMVLSCADSRVPPEFIFNVGLGDLFVVRSAGEVADRSIMASLEYGAEHLHIPLLVVMGHESCGAVKAAVDAAEVAGPNLQYLVKAIRAGTDRPAAERAELKSAILANVEQVINDLMAGSDILRHATETGGLLVVGGYYELGTGRVLFSDPLSSPHSSKQ